MKNALSSIPTRSGNACSRAPRSARYAQRGMAVIAALVVVTTASLAATRIIEWQGIWADTLAGERDRVQARWLLRGALDWARVILLNDARHNAVTLQDAIWAQPIAALEIRRPSGGRSAHFSGQIEDEQGKFNVLRLAANGSVQPKEVAALATLLQGLAIPGRIAETIAQRVADAQAAPQTRASATALREIQDLRGVQGVTPEQVSVLLDYLSVLPAGTPINVNTARPEVLSASIPGLGLAQARSLVEARDRGVWFTSRGDFLNRLNDPTVARDVPLDVRSDWFKVNGFVTLDHATLHMRALLQRPDDGPPIVRWMGG